MLQLLTRIDIVDNSGVINARIIKVLTPKNSKIAKVGSLVMISAKNVIKNANIIPGSKFKTLIIRSKNSLKTSNYILKGDTNAGVLVKAAPKNEEFLPVGTRIRGPISFSLYRLSGYQKVISIAKHVI